MIAYAQLYTNARAPNLPDCIIIVAPIIRPPLAEIERGAQRPNINFI